MFKKRKNDLLLRNKDPFFLRESQKYSNPLPSREFIIDILKSEGVPINIKDLAIKLSITKDELDSFKIRLKAMVRDGQIYINRKKDICVADKINIITCKVIGHKDGFGFAVPISDFTENELFISERQMRSLMHGDIVSVKATGFLGFKGKKECKVIEILERANKFIIARIYLEKLILIAIPEDKRVSHTIILSDDKIDDLNFGKICLVELDTYPVELKPATGHIVKILGDYDDPGIEIDIAINKFNLPYLFSDEALAEVDKINDKIDNYELNKRVDLRHVPLITIDSESAKDFDDAVFCKVRNKDYVLIVAISDVSYYVKEGSAIDIDAYNRGTSVYFPRKVIPMLPEKLSNNICSLKSGVDRLSMVCEILISKSGDIKKYDFYPAVIRNHARVTYNQVWDYVKNGFNDFKFREEILNLYNLFKILYKNRKKRGALDFDIQETEMVFDENNKIAKINPIQRNDIHRLIEEFMLFANVCAADFVKKNNYHALFRFHPPPSEEKLATLREQLSFLGLSLGGGNNPSTNDYAKVFDKIQSREDKSIIQTMLLRSMQQAVYNYKNSSHFGLAYDSYTHFTSPIRRYPDLMIHRSIKHILANKKYEIKDIAKIGVHCSLTERRAEEASRDIEQWLKTYYMKDKIGCIFQGIITSVTSFGLFVTLKDIYVEGMIHISDLGRDYFHFRPDILSIIGERTKVKFQMGDTLEVKVVSANLDSRKIDLALVEDEDTTRKKSFKKTRKFKGR